MLKNQFGTLTLKHAAERIHADIDSDPAFDYFYTCDSVEGLHFGLLGTCGERLGLDEKKLGSSLPAVIASLKTTAPELVEMLATKTVAVLKRRLKEVEQPFQGGDFTAPGLIEKLNLKREAIVAKKIQEVLKREKKPKHITIVYGAAHMTRLEKIVMEQGFKPLRSKMSTVVIDFKKFDDIK